jgi:hypothetical protein
MSLEETMKAYGFNLAASCAGIASYTMWIKHKGKRAYISVTDINEKDLPQTLDDPVNVSIIDLKSGDELEKPQKFETLKSYLDTLPIT